MSTSFHPSSLESPNKYEVLYVMLALSLAAANFSLHYEQSTDGLLSNSSNTCNIIFTHTLSVERILNPNLKFLC